MQLRKEAESNRDMVAAYALQVKEVFDSYVSSPITRSTCGHAF